MAPPAMVDTLSPLSPLAVCKLLADETRLRCLTLIAQHGELCVCELTHAIDDIQPKISRHLAQLRTAEILLDRRSGQWVFYRLNPDLPAWAHTLIGTAAEAWQAQSSARADLKRLKTMVNRPGRCCV